MESPSHSTRDALFARVEWEGLSITLVDTAGLGEPKERVEALGIERTRAAVESADLAVLLIPPEAPPSSWAAPSGVPVLEVRGKADLFNKFDGLSVSGLTGAGVDELRQKIVRRISDTTQTAVALGGERHRDALVRAGQSLERAASALTSSTLEVVAGEIGLALAALDEVTGEDASQEVIDAIFRKFCIGK
jgi:tRNA modification GTPase